MADGNGGKKADSRGRAEDKSRDSVRKRSSVIRRLLKWTLLTVAGFLALILLLWGGLQTPWAKEQLAKLVAHITAETDDYQVRLKGLNGLLPFAITFEEATISDKKGPWLSIDRFDFAMNPWELISGRLTVKWLLMDHLTVSRLPQSQKTTVMKQGPTGETAPLSLPPVLVREIALERIDLGEALAGRPMRFTLKSQVKTAKERVALDATLKDLKSGDNAFVLKAVYHLNNGELAANVAYHEAGGGLVAGLTGLKDLEGIKLTAAAKGSLSHIKGNLKLKMGGYGKTDLIYDIGRRESTSLALTGKITPDNRIVPPQVTKILTSQEIDLALNASISPEKSVQLDRLEIKSGEIDIDLRGTADLKAEEMDLRARIAGVDPSPFLAETGISIEKAGPMDISAVGHFMEPKVGLSTTVEGLTAEEASINGTALNMRALFLKGFKGLKSFRVALDARELKTRQTPKLTGPLKIEIDARSPDFASWQVKSLKLAVPGLDVLAENALLDPLNKRFSGNLKVHAEHIAALLPPGTPKLDGRLTLDANVKGTGLENTVAQLNLALSRLSGLPPEANALAGPEVTLAADAEMRGERINLKSMVLRGSQVQLASGGWLNPKERRFDATYELDLDHSGKGMAKVKDLPIGRIKSKGRIRGAFNDFQARVALDSPELRMNDLEIRKMETRLDVGGLPKKPSGDIRLKAFAMNQPLTVKSDFAWNGKKLSVKGATVQVPGIHVDASVHLTPGTQDFGGTVKGKIDSLEMVRALTGMAAGGKGFFQIETGKPNAPGGTPSLILDAQFKDLKYQDHGAKDVRVKARLNDIKKMDGRVKITATGMPLGNSRIETLNLGAGGSLQDAEITLETKGIVHTENHTPAGAPFFLYTKVRAGKKNLWRVRLEAMKAGYENLKIHLQKPALLTYGDDGRMSLDDLQLKMDKGIIRADAKMDQKVVTAKIQVADLPLSLLEPFVGQDMDGSADLKVDLSGPLGDPGVRLGLHVKEYKIMGRDGAKPILLNAKLNTRRDGNRLLADLELSGLGKTPFKVNGSLPAHISLKPFVFDLEKSGRLEGKLLGNFDLAVLQTFPAMSDQSIRGKLDIALGVGGSIEKWALNGGVTISQGRYENAEQGVLLDRIEGRLDAEGRILKLTRLSATDGGTGTVSLNGQTDVDPPFAANIALAMKSATLLRKETLSVTAGGNLKIKGNKDRMDLTGKIDLERTEIAIPKRFPPDVPVIPVRRINDPAAKQAPSQGKKESMNIQMDLGINIPNKFFVRGRGLDVEFKGQLTAKGPVSNPVIRGSLDVVKGTFLCLSRTFNVTSGQIAFDGSAPPVPFLNINTEVDAGEITAKVDVSGPADAFRLKLSSQPTLPQDEIMAQILFGQSVAKLNTFQALQLAYSVNQLAGGYGPDVLGKTRSFLGLDRIGFSGGDENGKNSGDGDEGSTGPSVTLGKYVTERIYVGVEQDLTDAKQDVIVEVDVTPNFTVESKAGTKSGAGIGFNWNYDY